MAKKLFTAFLPGRKMCSLCFTKVKSEGKKAPVHNLTNDADVSPGDSETKPWKVTAKIHEAKCSAETTFLL